MQLLAWFVLLSAVVTALGWVKTVWFFSVGYAASVVAMCVATLLLTAGELTLLPAIQLALLTVWGVRLGTFLLRRERAASYAQRTEPDRRQMAVAVRLAIWVMCFLLYPAMVAPAVLAAQAGPPRGGWFAATIAGLLVLAVGVVVEWLGDAQKQKAKEVAPREFVRNGLYGWVRVPNYLGEILVWLGSLLAGAYALVTVWEWGVALFGAGMLLFIMIGATRRIERTQNDRYGADPEFQQYVSTVPILIPWVPIHSLRNVPIPEL